MAPDPSDPLMFASIRLLLHKQHKQQMGKSSRSRSSHSKLLLTTSSETGGFGGSNRRHYKCKCRRRSNSKVPLHYLKPGALAQLRDAQRSARFSSPMCSKKKSKILVDEVKDDEEDSGTGRMGLSRGDVERTEAMGPYRAQVSAIASMTPGPSLRMFGPLCPQRKKLLAPKTTLPSSMAAAAASPITPVNSS